jgi:uncharacterized membrane protein YfcA
MIAGFGIGVVAALIGVAGGELLIPTIVMLYAVDIKIAGSVALAVSLPTMLVAFARYSRDKSFSVLRANGYFVVAMAAGSVVGTVVGGLVLDVTPTAILIPLLVLLLLFCGQSMGARLNSAGSRFPQLWGLDPILRYGFNLGLWRYPRRLGSGLVHIAHRGAAAAGG